jgi:hypothetical protein
MTTFFKTPNDSQINPYLESIPRPVMRRPFYKLTLITSAFALGLLGCAQTPVSPTTDAATSNSAASMAMGCQDKTTMQMDSHMKMMRETHHKMMSTKSPEERQALMAAHMKQMHEGMAMMDGSSTCGMSGMSGMHGSVAMTGDLAARQQMMEKRMEMMQTMMQMMMDRMPQPPSQQ